MIGSNLSTSVGHSGIWSLQGISGSQNKADLCNPGGETLSVWSRSVFTASSHGDSTGIITPSGTFISMFLQDVWTFLKLGVCLSLCKGIQWPLQSPPVAPMPHGPGGPRFKGPHAAEPAWNSLIKTVSSSTENNGPQTVRLIIQQINTQFYEIRYRWIDKKRV